MSLSRELFTTVTLLARLFTGAFLILFSIIAILWILFAGGMGPFIYLLLGWLNVLARGLALMEPSWGMVISAVVAFGLVYLLAHVVARSLAK